MCVTCVTYMRAFLGTHAQVAVPTAWHMNATLKYPNSSVDWDYSNSIEPGPLSRLQLLGEAAQHSQRFGAFPPCLSCYNVASCLQAVCMHALCAAQLRLKKAHATSQWAN